MKMTTHFLAYFHEISDYFPRDLEENNNFGENENVSTDSVR